MGSLASPSGSGRQKQIWKCELCDMFLVVIEERTISVFICVKCTKLGELQAKVIELHEQIKALSERNACLKVRSNMQDIFNATVLTGAAGPGPHPSALFASTLPIQDLPSNVADQVNT